MNIRPTPEIKANVIQEMRDGATDAGLSRLHPVSRMTLRTWRKAAGIAPHPKTWKGAKRRNGGRCDKVSDEELLIIGQMILTGMMAKDVMAKSGRSKEVVRRARLVVGLPPLPWGKFSTERKIKDVSRPIRPEADALYSRIKKALSYNLDPSILHDAISDIYVAVLSGELAESEIEKRARKYTGRVIRQYADRWGAVSLDETIGDPEESLSRYAFLSCPHSAAVMDLALARGLQLA